MLFYPCWCSIPQNGVCRLQETKNQSFIKSAAILVSASLFVKIIGSLYKIPLFQDDVLGDAGIGVFQVTYSIYSFVLAIATAGIPVALSRLVSSAVARNDINQAKRYFSIALPAFAVIGFIAMAAMFLFAEQIASLMNNSLTAPGIRVLSPAVLFVCIISVYRGYTQGFENMIPTAMSQVVEVLCKAAFGIVVALWMSKQLYEAQFVSAGAIVGVTIGLGLCVPLLIWYKHRHDKRLPSQQAVIPTLDEAEQKTRLQILAKILKVSIPITIGASFMTLMTVIASSVVLGRLQVGLSITEDEASALFGIFSKGLTLYNLPSALIVPISVSIVPAIAAAIVRGVKGEAGGIMQSAVKLVNLLAMPASAGLIVLAGPILIALYDESRSSATIVLMLLGAASFFVCLQSITMAILQANGNERFTMFAVPIGGIVQIILDYFLVANTSIGIIGAAVGTLACFITICSLNIVRIKTKVNDKPKFGVVFIKPLICTVVMGVVAFVVYKGSHMLALGVLGERRTTVIVALIPAIVLAIIAYLIMIIITHTITREDIKLVPKGEKLAKLLRIQ